MQARTGLAVGVDLGGTKIHAAVVDRDGRMSASHRLPTDVAGGPSKVVEDVVRCVCECAADVSRIDAVGIGVAGQVDASTGRVHSAPNLRWRDFPLGERAERALGLPVFVDNDVRAITWGVWRHGAGQGTDDLLVLFVGTGVGGGVVSGGRILTGDRGMAGELGHSVLVAGGRRCTCGNEGCLEAYVGGWAIAERAAEAAARDPAAGRSLLERAGGAGITGRLVTEAATEGDPLAIEILQDTSRYLCAAMIGFVHVFNPRRIVLGGGIVDGNPGLVDDVDRELRERAIPIASERLEVCRSELEAGAGVIGSASLALHRLDGRSAGTSVAS